MGNDAPSAELCATARLADRLDDEGRFAELYAAYRKPVHDFLVSSGGGDHTPDKVEELVQEVFLRAWRNRHAFRGESSARTYLFGIARNVLREDRRTMARTLVGNLDDAHVEPACADGADHLDPFGDVRHLASRIEPAIDSLSRRQQEAIRLVVIEGHSQREAAQLTEGSANAIHHRLTTALEHLRQSLARCPADQCPPNGPIPENCPALCRDVRCVKFEILANL